MNHSLLIITLILALIFFITISLQIFIRYLKNRHCISNEIESATIESPFPPNPNHSIRIDSINNISNRRIQPEPENHNNNNTNTNDQTLINSLPSFSFNSITYLRSSSSSTLDCAICISKFENHDQLRLLPICCHAFHSRCIDAWLLTNLNCPLCRSTVKFDESKDVDHFKLTSSGGNNSRSFRLEIGSVSRRRIDQSDSAIDLRNRSYSLGSFEYLIQDIDTEILVEVEMETNQRNRISVDDEDEEESSTVQDTQTIPDNLPESDAISSYSSPFAYSLQFPNVFVTGSSRRSDLNAADDGVGGGSWYLEGNRFGEEISDFFSFLSRV